MYKTIVFPTDFSETGRHALDWARRLAQQFDAELIVLHVHPTDMGTLGSMTMLNDATVGDASRKQLETFTNELKQEGLRVTSKWRLGNIDQEIVVTAREVGADLIVMGRRNLQTFFNWLAGTSAVSVAREAGCPVLVVPIDGYTYPDKLRSIGYATQLDGNDDAVIGKAIHLSEELGATLQLFHVRAENQPTLNDSDEAYRGLKSRFGAENITLHKTDSRTVTGGLDDLLKQNPVDLLVMLTRQRDFLETLLSPSLTSHVLKHLSMPVWVFHG